MAGYSVVTTLGIEPITSEDCLSFKIGATLTSLFIFK